MLEIHDTAVADVVGSTTAQNMHVVHAGSASAIFVCGKNVWTGDRDEIVDVLMNFLNIDCEDVHDERLLFKSSDRSWSNVVQTMEELNANMENL